MTSWELQHSIVLEYEPRICLFPFKLPERHRFRSAKHLKLEWSLISAIRVKSDAIDAIRKTQRRMRSCLAPIPQSRPQKQSIVPSLLHILSMRTRSNNTTSTILPNLPNLNRRKSQSPSHLVGPTFNLKHVAFLGGRDERSMNVRRDARFLTAISRDCQTSGPVCQARGHGSMQGALGIEMARFYLEPRSEHASGCGDERNVREEEFVEGAVPPHVGPVRLEV